MQNNPSSKELTEMYLPAHSKVGEQDWFAKKLMQSNSKKKVTNKTIIGGIETRGSILTSSVSIKIRQERNSYEKSSSIVQNLSLIRILNDRLARRKQESGK